MPVIKLYFLSATVIVVTLLSTGILYGSVSQLTRYASSWRTNKGMATKTTRTNKQTKRKTTTTTKTYTIIFPDSKIESVNTLT